MEASVKLINQWTCQFLLMPTYCIKHFPQSIAPIQLILGSENATVYLNTSQWPPWQNEIKMTLGDIYKGALSIKRSLVTFK